MQLTDFLYGLIDEGVVSVAGEVTPFDETDNELAVEILKQYYKPLEEQIAQIDAQIPEQKEEVKALKKQ